MNLPKPDSSSENRKSPKTFRLVFAIIVLCVCAYFVWYRAKGPRYKGEYVSHWIGRACRSANNSGQFDRDVKEMGSSAVPFLIKELQVKDAPWRNVVEKIKTKLPSRIESWLPDVPPAEDIHTRAAYYLAILGPDAKPALPQLLMFLNSQSLENKSQAIEALAAIGPEARAALPKLLDMVTNGGGDQLAQVDAAWAVWQIDRETNVVLQVFDQAKATASADPGMLMNATMLLSQIGPAAAPTLPDLVRLVGDNSVNSSVRGNAALALGRIGIKNDSVMNVLSKGTNDLNSGLRNNCALSLWALDNQYAGFAVHLVIAEFVDLQKTYPIAPIWLTTNWFVQRAEYSKCDIKSAIPALKEITRHGKTEERRLAEDALKQIELLPASAAEHK